MLSKKLNVKLFHYQIHFLEYNLTINNQGKMPRYDHSECDQETWVDSPLILNQILRVRREHADKITKEADDVKRLPSTVPSTSFNNYKNESTCKDFRGWMDV